MGCRGSKIGKKFVTPDSQVKSDVEQVSPSATDKKEFAKTKFSTVAKVHPNLGPLVMHRQGSMYFDEDGDLAHEFYVEVKEEGKSRMKRVLKHLQPQGLIKLPFPRLRSDCPVVIHTSCND